MFIVDKSKKKNSGDRVQDLEHYLNYSEAEQSKNSVFDVRDKDGKRIMKNVSMDILELKYK